MEPEILEACLNSFALDIETRKRFEEIKEEQYLTTFDTEKIIIRV
jgi:hypothetical protein